MTIPKLLFIFWNKRFTKIKLFFRSHVCEIFLAFFCLFVCFLLSFDLGYSVILILLIYWFLYDFIILSMAFFNFNCFNRKFYMINSAIRTSSNIRFFLRPIVEPKVVWFSCLQNTINLVRQIVCDKSYGVNAPLDFYDMAIWWFSLNDQRLRLQQ